MNKWTTTLPSLVRRLRGWESSVPGGVAGNADDNDDDGDNDDDDNDGRWTLKRVGGIR